MKLNNFLTTTESSVEEPDFSQQVILEEKETQALEQI